nr:MAG TPA: hypothetical protein [Caudoviricetes sp.]
MVKIIHIPPRGVGHNTGKRQNPLSEPFWPVGEWWGSGEYSKWCYATNRGAVGEWSHHSPTNKRETATRSSEPPKPLPRTPVPERPERPSEWRTAPPTTSPETPARKRNRP